MIELEVNDLLRVVLRNIGRDESEIYWYKVGYAGKLGLVLNPDDDGNEVTIEVTLHKGNKDEKA